MLLVAIKLALSGSLKNPVLVFDGLTFDGAVSVVSAIAHNLTSLTFI